MNLIRTLTTCALVYALGAAPVAAAVVVRSVDIVDGEVKTVDLDKGAVTNKKLASNAVNGAKADESTLGIVPNADQIDGRDSTSFMAGAARIVAARTSVGRGALVAAFSSTVGAELGFNVAYQCPGGSPSVLGKIEFRNRSGTPWEVWYRDGGDAPIWVEVAGNAAAEFDANQQTHSVKIRAARTGFAGSQATVIYSVTDALTTCKTAAFVTLFN